jgi:steroid delta-isomerase-like uncharacterized protein
MGKSSGELARYWFEEVWNRKRAEVVDEMLAPDCSGFMQGVGDVRGADEFKARMGEILRALPDLHIAIDDVIEDGHRATVRWTARATHAGGLGAPTTGRTVQIHGLIWMEFADGKLKHAWDGWNHDGLLRLLFAPEGGGGVV